MARPTQQETHPNPFDLVPEREFARGVMASLRTIRRWVALGIGPKRIVIGRKVFYRRSAIDKFLDEHERGKPEMRPARSARSSR